MDFVTNINLIVRNSIKYYIGQTEYVSMQSEIELAN